MTDQEYTALYQTDQPSEAERITNALTPQTGRQLAKMDEDAAYEAIYLEEQRTQLESRPQQIQHDAERATELILSSDISVRDAVRRAYLLGRAEQAAFSFDALIKTCRSQAEAREQT